MEQLYRSFIRRYILLFILTSISFFSEAQTDSSFIEGKILDAKTRLPLPYAHIYNIQSFNGTISNNDGYFKLKNVKPGDSVYCSYIGYQKQKIAFTELNSLLTIYMNESTNELNEVTVFGKDPAILFELVASAKKNVSVETKTGKAFFNLKSYYDNRQIEQVEGFYNVDVKNYDPVKLSIKTGRIALREYGNRLFTNLETSRVFTMQKMFEESKYFPLSPLEMPVKKSKRYFTASLHGKYTEDGGDSVYVIHFNPRNDSLNRFEVTVWILPAHHRIIKVKYSIKNAGTHPFFPLFKTDSIKSVDMEIIKTFSTVNNKAVINHIDFDYLVKYKSRNEVSYEISTNAVLHIFDFNSSFNLPFFHFSDPDISDYRKINAIPHNDYFWNHYSDFKMSDQYDENNEFYNHPLSVTNKKIFSANKYGPFGLMQHPYVQWNGKRILFKDKDTVMKVTATSNSKVTAKAQFYDLSVKVFLDVNTFGDSLQIISKTIFDPFESYFELEMDRAAQCFINIYFDLVEMERRKLVKAIAESDKKMATIKLLYEDSQKTIYYLKERYFRETERGKERRKLEKWNKVVKEELKIDNMAMFFSTTN